MSKIFDQVKADFAKRPRDYIERALGLKISGEGQDNVRTGHPGCSEEKGADCATVWLTSGNFYCKKCQLKTSDITSTYAAFKGMSGQYHMTRAAEALAEEMRLVLDKPRKPGAKNKVGLPQAMTPEILEKAKKRLLESPSAEGCRHFLKDHWRVSPQDVVDHGIGALQGKNGEDRLIFAMFDEQSGEVMERFKNQEPKKGSMRIWNSASKSSRCPIFWPDIKDAESYLVMEGESDVIQARCAIRLHESEGIWPVSLTHGKGTTIRQESFPEKLAKKKIYILQDVDAFQGPIDKIKGRTQAYRDNVRTHTLTTLHRQAKEFIARECEVFLVALPLDPVTHPKGDFRDWVSGGGREWAELNTYTYEDVYGFLDKIYECEDVKDVFNAEGEQKVKVTGGVNSIIEANISKPLSSRTECPNMGDIAMAKTCEKCGLPELLGMEPVNYIDWTAPKFRDKLPAALLARDMDSAIHRKVIHQARGCSRLSVTHAKCEQSTLWEMKSKVDSEKIQVLSPGSQPDVIGNVEVIGRAYSVGRNRLIVADSCIGVDRNERPNLEPVAVDLLTKMPHNTDDLAVLSRTVEAIGRCVGDHITRAHNRVDIQIGALLLMNSVTQWVGQDDELRRGWLDICIMGNPRQGKSKTISALFDKTGMGYHNQGSSSGLTDAGLKISHAENKVTPGLFPQHSGRAICLDEMQQTFNRKDVIEGLAAARSDGVVDSSKSGQPETRFPAQVRLCCVANYPQVRRNFLCENLWQLYRSPEAVSRLDFPMFVDDRVEFEPAGVPNDYNLDMIKAVIQRAWAQSPEDVVIDPECFDIASEKCREWDSIYVQDLPLFTGQEKAESVIRIAISVANLVFSHPANDPERVKVEVRPVHIRWACQWLEKMWAQAQYLEMSDAVRQENTVIKPIRAQAILCSGLDADEVIVAMVTLLDAKELQHYQALLHAPTIQEKMRLFYQLKSLKVIRVFKSDGKLQVELTKDGRKIVERIIELAERDDEAYVREREQWSHWADPATQLPGQRPSSLNDDAEWEEMRSTYGWDY